MKIIGPLVLAAAMSLTLSSNAHANLITEVLSGTDNGFGFSGIHHATGCSSMCGANFSSVSLSNAGQSFFHANDLSGAENFRLYLNLDDFGGSQLTLSGILDFTVATGQLIGTIAADFADDNIHADTFFKFVKGTMPVAGMNVPSPNGIDGTLFSLWGANSSTGPLRGSIGFDPNTADLGIDLVVKWKDPVSVPVPGSLALLILGLFGMRLRRRVN
ncbi:MAG: PEP-CTERM sorting domain-containing protein [Halioglobus sp.]